MTSALDQQPPIDVSDAKPPELANYNAWGTGKAGNLAIGHTPIVAFQWVLWMGAALIASGFFHLAWLLLSKSEWNGPLSLRKPSLFGISAGLTAGSIAWVLTKLRPHRLDRMFAKIMAGSLVAEVGLITLQQWRGVPSHFNHATIPDAAIEVVMLGMIFVVTGGIVWLTLRSFRLPPMDESYAIAIRGGLWLLTVSCALGLLATVLGEINLVFGKSPESWGRAGVLKFPHGAALHAIQLLPVLAWSLSKLRVSNSAMLVRSAFVSQVLLLLCALSQTLQGRARFDFDVLGGTLFVTAGILLMLPAVAIVMALASFIAQSWTGKPRFLIR